LGGQDLKEKNEMPQDQTIVQVRLLCSHPRAMTGAWVLKQLGEQQIGKARNSQNNLAAQE